ncbi:putative baseplate assembly protein [Anabaena sp. UHCC 0399]|uniref:putative baseplate assembly protein n=1 Tax=Anabaena sp. UHCC 0399 TaxID=3110238 RepID=UPI002B21AEF2|nr:putative baseplate assembly protein [Anabaena sp. UHCC 0399]MEA5567770.1 putative baseplate assembly protein [Anabaena sp. UHCC 0399]
MSIHPPKIDQRTYEEIVEQTVKLVQYYTAQESSELVDNKAEFLRDRILAEDITNTEGNIIKSGTLIDVTIADAIAKVKGLEKINVKLKGWWKPDKPDAGLALIRIFGRMAATVSDRLNRVPEKNFLVFLDLLGTQILPPQPARVPLTFSLASGLPENTTALVPAYTQISAPPTEGEEEEVVFETESDVLITSVQLQAVFVRNLETDKYSDRTLQATGGNDAFFAFEADTAIEHSFYLASELFTLPAPKTVTLTVQSSNAQDGNNLSLDWSYWDGNDWQLLSPTSRNPDIISKFPAITHYTIDGLNAPWLRAKLPSSFNASPQINSITATVNIERNNLAPERCFFNTIPIDLSKDFYPFGEQPRFNDTFYIASQAMSLKNATVTVTVTLSKNLPINPNGGDVEVVWEAWNGTSWEPLQLTAKNFDEQQITDLKLSPIKFTASGKVEFKLSETQSQISVNGETNYWLRIRIVKGNYGSGTALGQLVTLTYLSEKAKDTDTLNVKNVRGFMLGDTVSIITDNISQIGSIKDINLAEKKLILTKNIDQSLEIGTTVILNSTASFAPPSVLSLKLDYTYEISNNISNFTFVTYNNFKYVKQVIQNNIGFSPFTSLTDTKRYLYLGFDRPFPNRAIALYFQVESPTAQELATATTNAEKPSLVWEYFNGKIWTKLSVIDETAALRERGLIKFIGPSDLTATQEFNQTLYWLRVCWEKGHFRVQPRLRRILTNTIWASQTTTLQNEILGFSDGNPNQIFRTLKSPILPGQQLEFQEQKIPSSEEQIAIKKLEGKGAISIIRDEKGDVETVWVRWHEVSDFYQSGMRDRHYTINRLTGEIKFGDGQQGMIPPLGRNNIRMTRYKTDGGVKGNKPAQTITQLKTSIPFINSVTNLEPAGSGADREPIERVKERGPKFIRHRNRAVTAQDFEDLAYEASPDVARAKVIAPIFDPLADDSWLETNRYLTKNSSEIHLKPDINPGQVTLLIVPKSSARQPVPSLALIERVETYIRARCHPTINLIVTAPDWQQVSVTAVVVPVSPDVADAVTEAVIKRLEEFLHPLTGGKQGQGWAFGRQPQMSDLYAVIEGVPGVDHIHELTELKVEPLSPKQLVYSSSHTITLLEE